MVIYNTMGKMHTSTCHIAYIICYNVISAMYMYNMYNIYLPYRVTIKLSWIAQLTCFVRSLFISRGTLD